MLHYFLLSIGLLGDSCFVICVRVTFVSYNILFFHNFDSLGYFRLLGILIVFLVIILFYCTI